ncbi:hypothetical protein GQ55_2G117700 [Panicum hallii var. hallii]|uniref:O-methyltransferase domain-containing protein n=1 Tax=Panicum hallii var. hallii TaxID=1504633 RepID=A0A2T7ENZ5_9POAL|nr:hypothetical protein GQ55_2G117700 [Panicum hallii var. hallii]
MEQEADAELPHTRGELLQASIDLTHHTLSYVKSMALRCAVQLGIADAIRRAGGDVSLDGLAAALSLAPSKLPYLRRVMRALTASGVFAQAGGGGYRLTPVSTLLLSDGGGGGCRSLQQLVRIQLSPFCVSPVTNLAEWFSRDEETPFAMTFGTGHWDFCVRDPGFSAFFNGAMACDSRFVMDAVIHEVGGAFDGVTSMVDVAGGTGGAAKAVAAAFPQIKCTVLDLPHVIHGVPPADGRVEFVAGDMMDFIPQADALLLKSVLHDWSDEDCVRILKRCKEAICRGEQGGKLIIIDLVVGSSSRATTCHETQLLFDLFISTLTQGRERDEKEWCKLFKEVGFRDYKVTSVLDIRSVIEVFP